MNKFDATIIIPFYKKYDEFMYALTHNYDQFENVKEVIIIIDENVNESQLARLSYIQHHDINFKLYKNTEDHPWRNPAVVLNHGIKNASGKYCIIISPETILLKDAIKIYL